jgi:hypothetical protein
LMVRSKSRALASDRTSTALVPASFFCGANDTVSFAFHVTYTTLRFFLIYCIIL